MLFTYSNVSICKPTYFSTHTPQHRTSKIRHSVTSSPHFVMKELLLSFLVCSLLFVASADIAAEVQGLCDIYNELHPSYWNICPCNFTNGCYNDLLYGIVCSAATHNVLEMCVFFSISGFTFNSNLGYMQMSGQIPSSIKNFEELQVLCVSSH